MRDAQGGQGWGGAAASGMGAGVGAGLGRMSRHDVPGMQGAGQSGQAPPEGLSKCQASIRTASRFFPSCGQQLAARSNVRMR